MNINKIDTDPRRAYNQLEASRGTWATGQSSADWMILHAKLSDGSSLSASRRATTMARIVSRFITEAIGILLCGFLIWLNHLGMLPTPQESALVILLGLLSWFIAHQGSHCTYVAMGQTERATPLKPFLMIIESRDSFWHGVLDLVCLYGRNIQSYLTEAHRQLLDEAARDSNA